MRRRALGCLTGALALVLASCGGDGGTTGGGGGGTASPTPSPTPTTGGRLFTDPAQRALSVGDVQQIIAQAVGEAQARGLPATVAVVDRVGNVLGVFAMTGTPGNTRISRRTIAGRAVPGDEVGLQGVQVPTAAAAIAKAITGAYLSSGGNAFSTRTASQIVQEHFPPAASTVGLESGPLFGVQFSQLPCSDLSTRMSDGMIGPQRSPLGLAADPGGFPLYKYGVVVGGIGVAGDGDYGFDPDTIDVDRAAEEFAAVAGPQGFTPPRALEAARLPVDATRPFS